MSVYLEVKIKLTIKSSLFGPLGGSRITFTQFVIVKAISSSF